MVLYHFQSEGNDRFVWLQAPAEAANDSSGFESTDDAANNNAAFETGNKPLSAETTISVDTPIVKKIEVGKDTEAVDMALRKYEDSLYGRLESAVPGVKGRVMLFAEGLSGPVRGRVEKTIDSIVGGNLRKSVTGTRRRIGISARNVFRIGMDSKDMLWLKEKVDVCDKILRASERDKLDVDDELEDWQESRRRMSSGRWIPRPDKVFEGVKIAVKTDRNKTALQKTVDDIRKTADEQRLAMESAAKEKLSEDYGITETAFRKLFFRAFEHRPAILEQFEVLLKGAAQRNSPTLARYIEKYVKDPNTKAKLKVYCEELTRSRLGRTWLTTIENTLPEKAQDIAPNKLQELPIGRIVTVSYMERRTEKGTGGNKDTVVERMIPVKAYIVPVRPNLRQDPNSKVQPVDESKVVKMRVVREIGKPPSFPSTIMVNFAINKVELSGPVTGKDGIVSTALVSHDFNPTAKDNKDISFEARIPESDNL